MSQKDGHSHFHFIVGNSETLLLTLSTMLLLLAAGMYFAVGAGMVYHSVLFLSVVLSGWRLVPKAFKSVKKFRFDIYVLIIVAVIGALFLGEWFEAALASLLFSVSGWLEHYSQHRAQDSIHALLSLTPDTATVLAEDRETNVRIEDVAPGSKVLIRPGERVPLDGRVIEGQSYLDESPLTGESNPQAKEKGDSVLAGSMNQDGLLVIQTEKPFQDSIISNVARLVDSAKRQPTEIETTVESFAKYYTPLILVIALSVFLAGSLLTYDWTTWFYRALVILVVGCPCAFLISTPVAMLAALSNAARHGVIIKGGRYLEEIGRARSISFDKTGALTEGRPQVSSVSPLNGYQVDDVLLAAGALSQGSTHPLSRSIWEYSRERIHTFPATSDFNNLPGRGAAASINGMPHWLGSLRLMQEQGVCTEEQASQLQQSETGGKTLVAVAKQAGAIGAISLCDPVRSDAVLALERLRELGVDQIAMLTGDRREAALGVAEQLRIEEVHAQLLPQDKAELIQSQTLKAPPSIMVGDGINDAPALASASVGVAIGARGSDIAIESAPITLLADDLTRIPWLIGLSRRTRSVIHSNIAIALGIKFGFVLMAVMGASALWVAVLADVGAALLVILNSMRLLRWNNET
ncbi:MAG: cation-translocating P-type ATPase [Candidatus Hinthialibacter antarcticus]|nr:cation-translocating P-type ATPase [Candidatus Hinthialibacter antarcticus]